MYSGRQVHGVDRRRAIHGKPQPNKCLKRRTFKLIHTVGFFELV